MRDHEPVVIEEFNGLWARGDKETCPLDHFVDCNNISFIESGFRTRDGINVHQVGDNEGETISDVVRLYTYVHNNQQSLLVLDTSGNIYHTNAPLPFNPILTIPEMTDFAFTGIAGRAYITPHDGVIGLEDEFLYVYMGDGTPARKAGGSPPTGNTMAVAAGGAGNIEAGIHIFGVVYETNTGFRTQVGPDTFPQITFSGATEADITGIPVSPSSFVVARHIVATKAINPVDFTGNTRGYQFFFVPDGRIPNNSATTFSVNFYDVELLDDASKLLDILSEIPAGVNITTYHDRTVLSGFFADSASTDPAIIALPSTMRISKKGEPEAFDTVTGVITTPLEGNPLTNAQEYRDVLYAFKRTRTYAYSDTGDEPSTWPLTIIDQGLGASVHGVSQVLDSGGVNIEYLVIIDFSGILLFNGTYTTPELSFKVKDFWFELDRDDFQNIQIVNDTLNQILYMNLPDKRMFIGDYGEGMDPKNIKWAIWRFLNEVTSITLLDVNRLIIGSRQAIEE